MSRRPRTALLVVALATAVTAPAVSAAPKRCPLVVDQAGDTAIHTEPRVERDMPEVDLRSVDVVSDQRTMTAVLRVRDLAHASPENPTGVRWGVGFRVDGSSTWMYLWAVTAPTGVQYVASYRDASGAGVQLGPVDGALDAARNEVRITAPLEVFAPASPLRPGTLLADVAGVSGSNWAGAAPSYRVADTTWPGVHRIAGPSCVR